MEKKVSVIIPFYYGAKWISDAIDSVLSQTYKNVEIVVVNDCSPENIDDIINKYKDKIVYIKHETNQGSGPARNTGINHSSGDYIAFLDSDDLWLPTKLEEQMNFMESNGAKWCHTGYYHWFSETDNLKQHKFVKDYGKVFPHILVVMGILQSSVIIDKSILDDDNRLRFNPNYKYGQDVELYSRIACKYPISFIKKPLVKKRVTGYEIYSRARLRLSLHAKSYQYWKKNPYNGYYYYPKTLSYIGLIYNCYDKILPKKESNLNNFISKCLWVLPFVIERFYRLYLDMRIKHDIQYLKD